MNLNYNINNTLLGKNRNFLLGKVEYYWQRAVSVAAGLQSGSIIFGTGSIAYTPFGPTTLFVSGTYQAQQLGSGSALGLPVNISVTGSGVWPTTGSNVLYINVGGNLGFNNNTSSIFSAAAGNMNLSSGSKISSSFTPIGIQEYNIDFGLTHIKGNIYNPLINWSAVKTSPFGNNVNVNGEVSASFNLVQNTSSGSTDKFTNLAFIKEVSGSAQSSSFNNEFGFSVTASYTASINNVTGSTTMSFVCSEESVNNTIYFFNPTTTLAIGTASFVATNDTTHNLVTSINYNKGNTSNSNIGWKISGSGAGYGVIESSSFNIRKDANITMATASFTASVSSSYLNDYAFNQTASISSSFVPYFSSGSEFFYVGQLNLEIPEINFSSSKWISSSLDTLTYFTSSFTATTGISNYSITASVKTYGIPQINYLIVGGGGGGGRYSGNLSNSGGTGGGAGGLITGSAILSASVSYPVIVGKGGLGAAAGPEDLDVGISGDSSSFNNLIVSGGGYGGAYTPGVNFSGANGGSGGGNGGLGTVGQGNNGSGLYGGGKDGGYPALPITWANGLKYAGGGGGFGINALNQVFGEYTSASIGGGGNGRLNINNVGENGSSGSVVINYKGTTAVATGGTITISGSYVYHTFTASGNFAFDKLPEL